MLPKPPNGYLEKAQADHALLTFLKAKKFDMPTPLPKRVEPRQAGEFATKALEKDALTAPEAGRLSELVRFYNLRQTAPTLAQRLNRRESGEAEWQRALVFTTLLADVGDDAQGRQAAEYLRYLAGMRPASEAPELIVGAYFALPASADPKIVTDFLDAEQRKAQAAAAQSQEADRRAAEMESLKADRLARVERARKRKFEILAVRDPARRRGQLARVYLELEVYPTTSMPAWSLMMLQRECDESTPAELAAVFSEILDLMRMPTGVVGPTGQKPSDEEELGLLTRCARAIEFYLGSLTEDQQKYVDSKKGFPREQDDPLWWELETAPASKDES